MTSEQVVDSILEAGRRKIFPRFRVDVCSDPMAFPIEIYGFRDGYRDRVESMSVEDAKQLLMVLFEAIDAIEN